MASTRLRVATAVMLSSAALACSSTPEIPPLAEALERQPAELVSPLDGGFEIGPAGSSCGGRRRTEVFLLDPRTGEKRWDRDVPWAPDGAIAINDLVVSVARRIDGNPPSVVAAELETGAPRWQRFIAAERLRLAGIVNGTIAVYTGEPPERLLQLDARTGELRGDRRLQVPVEGPPSPGRLALFEDQLNRPVVVDLATARTRSLARASHAATDGARLFTVTGATLHATNRVDGPPLWSADLHDRAVGLVAGDGAVVVEPQTRPGVIAFDAATGEQRWTTGGVSLRRATVTDGVLVAGSRRVIGVDLASGDRVVSRDLESFVEFETRVVAIPDPDRVVLPYTSDALEATDENNSRAWLTRFGKDVLTVATIDAGLLVTTGDDDFGCF